MPPPPGAVVRRHVWIAGRVQGVGFRASCAYRGERAGVAGWVRNLADGGVEAVLEGDATAVDDVVRWCRHGPRHASVRDVRVVEEAPEGLTGFSVR